MVPLYKWICEQSSMLISLSVRPAVRPGSLEMVQNQIATAHLPKSLLAPEPPPCLSVSPWKVALHPNKDLCYGRTLPLNLRLWYKLSSLGRVSVSQLAVRM